MYEKPMKAIQSARNEHNLTQEELAELTNYSVDSIRVWESGARAAPIPAIKAIAEKLDAPWLPVFYLREQHGDGLFRELIPEFQVGRSVSSAAAGFVSAMMDMMEHRFARELLSMVADERIDEVEDPVFEQLMDEAWALNRKILELRFSNKGGKRK